MSRKVWKIGEKELKCEEVVELEHKTSTSPSLCKPPHICEVVKCDVERITLEEALNEMKAKEKKEIEEVVKGIYAKPYEFKRPNPFLLNEYYFCPRLLWFEAKEKKRFMTADSIVGMVEGRRLHESYWQTLREMAKGQRLHERYGQFLASVDGIGYECEVGDVWRGRVDLVLKGRVDLVLKYGEELVPIEVKTSDERESYERQLQVYMALLGASKGYLVYRDKVVAVDPDPSALSELRKMDEDMKSPEPPPPARDCRLCEYRAVCEKLCEKYGVCL